MFNCYWLGEFLGETTIHCRKHCDTLCCNVNKYEYNIKLTWNNWELKSLGQMSLSPQKGLTVMVFSSKTGRLSLKPPSMYLMPWNLGGSMPENTGMKHDASSACNKYCSYVRIIQQASTLVRLDFNRHSVLKIIDIPVQGLPWLGIPRLSHSSHHKPSWGIYEAFH